MKQAFQIALLGFVSICAVPAALNAQHRDNGYRGDRYEQRQDFGRHDRYDHGRSNGGDYRNGYRNDRYAYNRGDYRGGYRNDGYAYSQNYSSGYAAYPEPYQPAYYDDRDYRGSSAGRSAAIIGGSAAAGAFIGAAAGHGQGAAIGAIVGGITGVVIDQATRDHGRYYDRR